MRRIHAVCWWLAVGETGHGAGFLAVAADDPTQAKYHQTGAESLEHCEPDLHARCHGRTTASAAFSGRNANPGADPDSGVVLPSLSGVARCCHDLPLGTEDIEALPVSPEAQVEEDVDGTDEESQKQTMEGHCIGGRFRVCGILGSGGAGIVYRGVDLLCNRPVALKTTCCSTPADLLQLKNEFRLLQGLRHPNLLVAESLIREEERFWVVLPLVDGTSLDDFTGGLEIRALEEICGDLVQIAHALNAIHERGIIHLDLKPANVLRRADGHIVLMDFGIAQGPGGVSLAGLEVSGDSEVVGSFSFMAPEQVAGSRHLVSAAADWYAFGVLMFRSLTGLLPFDGPARSVIADKLRLFAQPPSVFVAGVPNELDRLCLALLDRDPARRPTGSVVVDTFLHALKSAAVADSPGGFVERARGNFKKSVHASAERGSTVRRQERCSSSAFVGRAAEFAILEASFDRARGGTPTALLIEAGSGMGKSALVGEFLERLQALCPNIPILAGKCFRRENVPYKALDGIFDAFARIATKPGGRSLQFDCDQLARESLIDAFPVLACLPVNSRGETAMTAESIAQSHLDPGEKRVRLFAAMRALLFGLRAPSPLVIFIDDVQWADADSQAFIRALLSAQALPLLLVLARRPSSSLEYSADLNDPVGWGERVEPLRLTDLDTADIENLAYSALERAGTPDRIRAKTIAHQAAGNPMMALELVRVPALRGQTATLNGLLASKMAELGTAARDLLNLAAIASGPVEMDVATTAAAPSGTSLEDSLAALDALHLVKAVVERGDDAIDVYHDRVREVALLSLDAQQTRLLHQRLVAALSSRRPQEWERLYRHSEGAGDHAAAFVFAEQAGAQAERALAFDRAAELFRYALRNGEEIATHPMAQSDRESWAARRRRLEIRLANALANAGRGTEAAGWYERLATAEAAPSGASTTSIELLRRAADQHLRNGNLERGLSTLRLVFRQLSEPMPEGRVRIIVALIGARARTWAGRLLRACGRSSGAGTGQDLRLNVYWTASVGLSTLDVGRAAAFQMHFVRIAESSGLAPMRARAAAAEAMFFGALGGGQRTPWVLRRLDEAERLARTGGDPVVVAWIRAVRGFAAFLDGAWSEALAECREAERQLLCRGCVGITWELAVTRLFALQSTALLGDIQSLVPLVRDYIRQFEDRGDLVGAVNARLGFANLAWLAVDDVEAARNEIEIAQRLWQRTALPVHHSLLAFTRAQVALYAGEDRDALRIVESAIPGMKQSGMLRLAYVRSLTWDLQARCQLACAFQLERNDPDRGPLLTKAARLAARLEGTRQKWSRTLGTLLRAGIAHALDDRVTAQSYLQGAELGFTACDMGLHAVVSAWARDSENRLTSHDGLRVSTDQLRARGIANPQRMARLFVPTFAVAGG